MRFGVIRNLLVALEIIELFTFSWKDKSYVIAKPQEEICFALKAVIFSQNKQIRQQLNLVIFCFQYESSKLLRRRGWSRWRFWRRDPEIGKGRLRQEIFLAQLTQKGLHTRQKEFVPILANYSRRRARSANIGAAILLGVLFGAKLLR